MNIKFSLCLFLFVLLNNQCSNANKTLTCSDFKTGTFENIDEINHRKFIIKREKDYQLETAIDLKTNKKIVENKVIKIDWINDCEYKLLLDTTKIKGSVSELKINSKGGLNNRILNIKNNCATVETILEGEEKIMILQYCKKK